MKDRSNEVDPLHLLDLPVDILALILELLLISSYHHEDQSHTDSDSSSSSSDSFHNTSRTRVSVPMCPCSGSPIINPIPIFLVHPRIYALASPIFYAANDFELDATRRHAVHVKNLLACSSVPQTTELEGVSRRRRAPAATRSWAGEKKRLPEALQMRAILTKTDALRRIHRLRIKVDRLRGWIHTDLQPVVQDMILNGELVHLQIDLMTPYEGSSHKQAHVATGPKGDSPADEMDLFAHQPIAGLLSLLADPYLLTASLRVDSTHRSQWCPWHDTLDGGCLASRKAKSRDTSETDDNGTKAVSMWSLLRTRGVVRDEDWEMIEVDWRGIKRKVDPGGEDLARAVVARRV